MIEQGYRVWFNGAIVHESDAHVGASSRAASYGDGCFETLRSYSGKFVGWNEHIERLHAGMAYLGIRANISLQTVALKKSVLRLLQINRLDTIETRVRIQVWRSGNSGMDEESTNDPLVHIMARPATAAKGPLKLIVAKTRRIPSDAIDNRFKLSNYLNYILAGREASEQNADDALMLTPAGNVSECTVSNIFWLKGDIAFTPSLACYPLPGITRMLSIIYLKEQGIQVIEGEYMPDDIGDADAVWICNSMREWQAVRSVGQMIFNSSFPLYVSLRKSFGDYIKSRLE